ncbi:MAG TPA: DEAD/DEAH box helicase [Longimicrobiales bacterium]|nr:DEAD/DEAH box helicase [Longimicrobiales bacterium]
MAARKSDEASAGFTALGLDPRLVDVLTALGYEEPTPIQSQTIPPLLEGRDLVGEAATGTGKTAAFALPLLQRLGAPGRERTGLSALILVPTRELAMQVAEAVHRYGRALGVSVLPIYGGQSFSQQLRALKRGVDVVVATPGRALDHIKRGTLTFESLDVVVLDEADEMLNMGFAEDLDAILGETPEERQTVLFSATIPPRIAAIAQRHLRDPVQIRVARERLPTGAVPRVRQTAYIVSRAHKLAALGRVLDMANAEAALVFCRTRTEVDELTERMNAHGYRAEGLHGGMNQEQRDRVMKKLRAGNLDLVIATDVAARGLDVPRLTHVINYDVPSAPESYVHRIGRVGRAGREGVAITLAEPREQGLLRRIEELTKRKIEVARVPTVADLKARRLEVVRTSLRETMLEGGLDPFRVVVESLADEFDLLDIAVAAVKLVQEAAGPEAEEAADIPQATPPRQTRGRQAPAAHERKGQQRERPAPRRGAARHEGGESGVARLFIGAGRNAGIRPKDLVGAITGEAGIRGGDIGAIQIADGHSIVAVSESVAAEVVTALRSSTLKGKKVTVRRERAGDG